VSGWAEEVSDWPN